MVKKIGLKVPKILVNLGEAIEVKGNKVHYYFEDGTKLLCTPNGKTIWCIRGKESDNYSKIMNIYSSNKSDLERGVDLWDEWNDFGSNPCKTGMRIQSYLFPKSKWTAGESIKWLKSHSAKITKPHETDNYYRFRQESPKHFDSERTKTLDKKTGLKAIVGCPIQNPKSPTPKATILDVPKGFLFQVDRCHTIVYSSDKFTGKSRKYIHDFKTKPLMSVNKTTGPTVLKLSGGKIRITERGIEG